jgi:hypothetical protein
MRQSTRLRKAVEAREAVGEARPLDVRLARMAEAETTELAIRARREQADAIATGSPVRPRRRHGGARGRSDRRAPRDGIHVRPLGRGGAEARVREAEAALAPRAGRRRCRTSAWVFFQKDEAHGDPGDIGPQLTIGRPPVDPQPGWHRDARADLEVARAELEASAPGRARSSPCCPRSPPTPIEALGRLGDFEQDAREALDSIELGWTTGEIDVSEAVLLRREVLDGWVAALDARQSTVEARLEVLLATEDPHLIPADTAEEAR